MTDWNAMGGQHAALENRLVAGSPAAPALTTRPVAELRSFRFVPPDAMSTRPAPTLMRTPVVGRADDPFERQADAVADAVVSGRVPPAASPQIVPHSHVRAPRDGAMTGGASLTERPEDDLRSFGGAQPSLRRQPRAGSTRPDERSIVDAVRAVDGGGTALPDRFSADVGAALGHRFDQVRIHAEASANRAAQAVGARAFTVGNSIAFAPGEYAPESRSGRWLLAHELTHVAQQAPKAATTTSAAALPAPSMVQRQAPPIAPPLLLTEPQIQTAIAFNGARFGDPFTIATIRELIGIAKYPAVSDRDLALGIAQWQDSHPPLVVDGRIGPATTRTISDTLNAVGSAALRDQVRVDHTVTASANGPVVRTVPTPAAHGQFTLNASLNTTLRRGWIIQELRNTWGEVLCGGAAHPSPPTPHYWEAWWVTDAGAVRVPTSLATPPTHAAPAVAHDVWGRGLPAGTRGTFTIDASLFTALTLPAGFAIGAVADAVALPSTAAAPGGADGLGTVQGRRRASGRWDGCPPPGPNFHTP